MKTETETAAQQTTTFSRDNEDELAMLFTGSAAVPTQKDQAPVIEYVDETKEDETDGGRIDPPSSLSGIHTPSNASETPLAEIAQSPPPDFVPPATKTNHENNAPTPLNSGSLELDPSIHARSGPEPGPSSACLTDSATHSAARAAAKLSYPLFKIEQLGVDRRLLVNRKRQLKMYRVWMQGKFRKL